MKMLVNGCALALALSFMFASGLKLMGNEKLAEKGEAIAYTNLLLSEDFAEGGEEPPQTVTDKVKERAAQPAEEGEVLAYKNLLISKGLAEGGEEPPLEGPAHADKTNPDQEDHEFGVVSDGDGCVSWDDMQKTLQEQFRETLPEFSEGERTEIQELKRQMEENMRKMCDNADTNGDSCIDETEFKAAGDLEGYPPVFQEKKEDHMGEEMLKEDKMEFDAMDLSRDGKISRSECYHYTRENMDGADLADEDLQDMFDGSDANGDGFITWQEFEGAGAKTDGDGHQMENAVPMSFKVMMRKWKYTDVRAKVTKQLLSNIPPLEVLATMLNIDAHTVVPQPHFPV